MTSSEGENWFGDSGGIECAAWHYPGTNGACVIMAGGFAVPKQIPATLGVLVAVACRRWNVEEDNEFGKDQFGFDQSQVRLYVPIMRHITLVMAALAICAITAAAARTGTHQPPTPTRPDQPPPPDPGLIALTVTVVKRPYNLTTRAWHSIEHHLRWSWWRRRHQARARWYHHRVRLTGSDLDVRLPY